MNTDKIYIARLGVIKCKDYVEPGDDLASFYYIGKYKLVREYTKKEKYIDLETRERYDACPSEDKIGERFLVPGTFESFNSVTGNTKKHLSKNKVLSLYRSKRR